jgi:hypothetical protein
MKKKTKLSICGFILMFMTVLSAFPLVMIKNISGGGTFLYATISWAMMLFIGFSLAIWLDRMRKLNHKNQGV